MTCNKLMTQLKCVPVVKILDTKFISRFFDFLVEDERN